MRFLRNMSIRHRLTLVMTLTCCGALLFCATGFVVFDVLSLRAKMQEDLEARARLVTQENTVARSPEDEVSIRQSIEELNADLEDLRTQLQRTLGIAIGMFAGGAVFALAMSALLQRLVFTERKQVEDELACERDLLRTLMDHSLDHIYFKDVESRFLKCSVNLARRVGVDDPEKLVGRTDFDIFEESHARAAYEDEQRILRTGEPMVGKIEVERWANGGEAWVLTTKMPWRDKTGHIAGTFGISKDITALKKAEQDLDAAHRRLIDTSRQAGMAEVAVGVLHNVGNVLNSVNVSTTLLLDLVKKSRITGVRKLAALLEEHEGCLPQFLAADERGRHLPEYVSRLASHLTEEQSRFLKELTLLAQHIDHIKEIVAMQQTYAKVSGVREPLHAASLLEDALRINEAALARHDVHVRRDFQEVPRVLVDRHKVLQILINLVSNAKYALDAGWSERKELHLSIDSMEDRVRIVVCDNGIGISAENMERIFEHGFTTRKQGHGFGLHSSALVARELGGSLRANSEGVGRGATFILELPAEPQSEPVLCPT